MKCMILDDYQGVALGAADWSAVSERVEITCLDRAIGDLDMLVQTLAPFEIVVAMRERTVFDKPLLERLPKLKLLVTTGMANASIDMEEAGRRGVLVCGTEGSVGPAAELAWGLLLALKRNLASEFANFRGGGEHWQLSVGGDLMGKTLGVVGLGKLGKRIVRYGKAFDMNVLGWSRSNTPERSAELGIEYAASLEDLLGRSDAVVLQLKLNADTRGIIGKHELSLMKPDAVLVNTSRGPLVDEAALIEALMERKIGGAALDVFDQEPLPSSHPFRTLPNVVATPHLGYVTRETYAIYFADVVEDIAAWLDGSPVRVLNEAT